MKAVDTPSVVFLAGYLPVICDGLNLALIEGLAR